MLTEKTNNIAKGITKFIHDVIKKCPSSGGIYVEKTDSNKSGSALEKVLSKNGDRNSR